MFGRLGWAEILVIVILVVILFGHSKIPGMMKNLADGVNVFKKEIKDTDKKSTDKKEKTADKPVVKSAPKKVVAKTASVSGAKGTTKKVAIKKKTAKKH